MKNNKFWRWVRNEVSQERTLYLDGVIASESWFDDDITPALFKSELFDGEGDIVIWLNSPGGDCVAASQIYAMLMDYKGNVTVKIDGIAASVASVVAMAGTMVLMAPTAILMIHNPLTVAIGDTEEMQKAIDMLAEFKESIVNAYEIKTGQSRTKISHWMDAETWMNANKAIELGFADGILEDEKRQKTEDTFAFSRDVHNTTAEITCTIALDTIIPTVTVAGPDVAKISEQVTKNTSSFSFTSDKAFISYKVMLVQSVSAVQNTPSNVQLPSDGGSIGMTDSGTFAANTTVECSINGTDLKTAVGGSDGAYIVKVFVFDGVHWSA